MHELEWGNINANLIRSFLDIYEDTQEREIDRLQKLDRWVGGDNNVP